MVNKFIRRAFDKIDKLSIDEIKTLVGYQASENELLGKVFDSLEMGILVVSDTFRILASNNSVQRLLPISKMLLDGASLRYALHDSELTTWMFEMMQNEDQNRVVKREFNFQRGEYVQILDVTYRSFLSEVDAIFTHDVGLRHLFFLHDVSEVKRQEARLHRSESLASLTTVAAGVAHEIKNPLASIGIHLQLLRKAFQRQEVLSLEEAQRYLDIIDEEIESLNSIVVDFLFAVRPMSLHPRLEEINRIIEELLNFVEPELEQHDISIERRLDSYLPRLMVDENLIKQGLLNIIKNAMNAMEGQAGQLTFSTKLSGNYVAIAITDTGIGMTEETLAQIFEPYFTTKLTGSGLGLTMVFKMIKEHKGEIAVRSKVGKGTTFTLLLPVPKSERMVIEDRGGA